jgi:hypothetical protein
LYKPLIVLAFLRRRLNIPSVSGKKPPRLPDRQRLVSQRLLT